MSDAELGWCEQRFGVPEWNPPSVKAVRVNVSCNQSVVIDKLYGPLCASDVRVRLEYDDAGNTDWVVEYLNPTTEEWELKARWDCQENWNPRGEIDGVQDGQRDLEATQGSHTDDD